MRVSLAPLRERERRRGRAPLLAQEGRRGRGSIRKLETWRRRDLFRELDGRRGPGPLQGVVQREDTSVCEAFADPCGR